MSFQQVEGINGPGSSIVHTARKCSEKSRRSEKETPRTSKAPARAKPGTGGGRDGKSVGMREPLIIISRDFWHIESQVVIRGPSWNAIQFSLLQLDLSLNPRNTKEVNLTPLIFPEIFPTRGYKRNKSDNPRGFNFWCFGYQNNVQGWPHLKSCGKCQWPSPQIPTVCKYWAIVFGKLIENFKFFKIQQTLKNYLMLYISNCKILKFWRYLHNFLDYSRLLLGKEYRNNFRKAVTSPRDLQNGVL